MTVAQVRQIDIVELRGWQEHFRMQAEERKSRQQELEKNARR